MKKIPANIYVKPLALFILATFFSFFNLHAQQKKISLTGFNVDVIADPDLNATPDTLTNYNMDGLGYVFFTQGYSNNNIPYDDGLPVSGTLLSQSGHYFQLQPYNVNNDLEVDFYNNFSGTLTFSAADQISYDSLFILATAGSGYTFVAYTINFTDNTSTSGNFTVADWYCNGCTSYAVNSLSRTYQSDGTVNQPGLFAMYEYPIVLSPTDRIKQVTSIDFSAPVDATSFANIFAISGTGLGVLPVTLGYFNASLKNGEAVLQWKTTQELNNKQFIVERAASEMPDVFTRVGTIAAIPSANGSAYIFYNKPETAGTYLYRLSQQNADGNIKVMGVRYLSFISPKKWVIQDLGSQWKLVITDAFTYRITDVSGNVLLSSTGSGNTIINKPSAKGIYFIQVITKGGSSVQKIIN